VLTLLDTVFCPQDPVDVELGTEFEFASSYMWSTGDTTPTIRAMEEGDFMVTVTFDVGVCFELCDTSTISKKDFPQANIGVDLSGLCELDQIILNAGSTTEVAIAAWSTGDTINPLIITEGGNYSVTITDACENTASADITIDQQAFELEVGLIDSGDFCRDGQVTISAFSDSSLEGASYVWSTGSNDPLSIVVDAVGTYSVTVTDMCGDTDVATIEIVEEVVDIDLSFGRNNTRRCEFKEIGIRADADNNAIVSYLWSTGEDTRTIFVTEPGTYSVTVVDICGNEAAGQVTISPNELDFSINPQITFDIGSDTSDVCDPKLIVNAGSPLGGIGGYLWNTGETTDTISISSAGTYSVTVTDLCGNSGESTIEVTFDVLQYPNIFFPDSQSHDENKQFKPYISCPELFSGESYNLEVYNRWNNRVFETTNVAQGWNGVYSGSRAPEGVYIYYATWTDSNGNQQKAHGNVTLIR
jgi:gliding motility-associated-like protein